MSVASWQEQHMLHVSMEVVQSPQGCHVAMTTHCNCSYRLHTRLRVAQAADSCHIQGRWAFSDAVWAGVSEEAKDLIRSLLRRNPTRRPAAAALLQNPWVC